MIRYRIVADGHPDAVGVIIVDDFDEMVRLLRTLIVDRCYGAAADHIVLASVRGGARSMEEE